MAAVLSSAQPRLVSFQSELQDGGARGGRKGSRNIQPQQTLQQETHFPYSRAMQSVARHPVTLSAIVFGMNGWCRSTAGDARYLMSMSPYVYKSLFARDKGISKCLSKIRTCLCRKMNQSLLFHAQSLLWKWLMLNHRRHSWCLSIHMGASVNLIILLSFFNSFSTYMLLIKCT